MFYVHYLILSSQTNYEVYITGAILQMSKLRLKDLVKPRISQQGNTKPQFESCLIQSLPSLFLHDTSPAAIVPPVFPLSTCSLDECLCIL